MALADYKRCDVCGGKAFYDANITDPRYVATWDDSEDEFEPVGLAVLCSGCNKTHKAVIVDRKTGERFRTALKDADNG
ncbi:MAG: hypothetical protein ACE37E_01015 [Hyphomicrobiales bacterium]